MAPQAPGPSSINLVFITGRPGAGKDTQADHLLADLQDTTHKAVKTGPGELLRRVKNNPHDQLAQYVSEQDLHNMVERNVMIDDKVVYNLLKHELLQKLQEGMDTVIFAGYPRTIAQIPHIDQLQDELTVETGRDVRPLFMILESTDEISRQRSEKRREETQEYINQGLLPASALRDDDAAEKVERRIQEYHNVVEPTITLLKEEKTPVIVDATRDAQAVYGDVKRETFSFLGIPQDQETRRELRLRGQIRIGENESLIVFGEHVRHVPRIVSEISGVPPILYRNMRK